MPDIKAKIAHENLLLLKVISDHLGDFSSLADYLDRAIIDEPTAGQIIRPSFESGSHHRHRRLGHFVAVQAGLPGRPHGKTLRGPDRSRIHVRLGLK